MMGRAWVSVMSGTYSGLLQPAAVAARNSAHTRLHLMSGSFAMSLINYALNGRRVTILRDVGFDLIADGHLVHLGVIVYAHTPGFAIFLLDRKIFCSDVVHASDDRFLGNALAQGRGSRPAFRRILGASRRRDIHHDDRRHHQGHGNPHGA